MNNIPIELLHTFVIFAESPSIETTAAKLQVTQPTVSIQLQRLEDHLPMSPFTQKGRRKILNQYGKNLYKALKGRFDTIYADIHSVNLNYTNLASWTLKVGGRKELLRRILPKLKFPGRLAITSTTGKLALEGLKDQDLDIVVTQRDRDFGHEVVRKKLFTEKCLLIAHPKVCKGPLTLKEVKSRRFLTTHMTYVYNEEYPFILEWINHCQVSLKEVVFRTMFDDWHTIISIVESQGGYSIIPESTLPEDASVKAIPLPTSVLPTMTIYAYYRRELRNLGISQNLFSDFDFFNS